MNHEKDFASLKPAPELCANCGAQLHGRYCHQCGQDASQPASMWQALQSAWRGMRSGRSIILRTLGDLLLRPGHLTRAYFEGKRASYIAPLKLYFALSFIFFFSISLLPDSKPAPVSAQAIQAELIRQKTQLNALQKAQQELPASASAEQKKDLQEEISDTQRMLKDLREDAARAHAAAPAPGGELLYLEFKMAPPWLQQMFGGRTIRYVLQNRDLSVYKIQAFFAKYSLLLLLLSLPLIRLLFLLQPQWRMYQHSVFALYSLAAMNLLACALTPLAYLRQGEPALLLFCLMAPLHMFAQLRGAYLLGVWGALWRTLALSLIALFSLLIYGVLAVLLNM